MPFTFAHPAAVLALPHRKLVFSALVVGSMAPDFEYFFGLTHPQSHSMPGLVTFTYPVALAVLVIFQGLMKWPLISLLPRGMQARMIGPARRFRWLPASQLLLILLSLAVGIASHILLDGCTHPDGWAVEQWPAMRQSVSVPWHAPMPVWRVLQFAGTAVGMLLVALCFARWYLRTEPEDIVLRPQFSPALKWGIASAMIALAVVLGYLHGAAWYGLVFGSASHRERVVVGFTMVTTMAGAVELLGFGLVWRGILADKAAVRVNSDPFSR